MTYSRTNLKHDIDRNTALYDEEKESFKEYVDNHSDEQMLENRNIRLQQIKETEDEVNFPEELRESFEDFVEMYGYFMDDDYMFELTDEMEAIGTLYTLTHTNPDMINTIRKNIEERKKAA